MHTLPAFNNGEGAKASKEKNSEKTAEKKGDKVEKKGDKVEQKGDKVEKKVDKVEKKGDKVPEKKGDKVPEKKGDKVPEKKGDKVPEKKEAGKLKHKEKIVDAARDLFKTLMKQVNEEFLSTYARSLNKDDLRSMEIDNIFGDARFAGVCEKQLVFKDLYMCAKLLHELLKEYHVDKEHKIDKKHKVDYTKFMDDFAQRIWEPYYAMDFFKDAHAEGAGYWDRNEDNVYNLKNV